MAVYLVPQTGGRSIVIDKAVVFVGRHPDCDVVINHSRKVSRKHCCICQVNDTYVVRDLGSMNGIRVNGKRVRKEARIAFGDEVSIGDVPFRLQKGKTAAKPPQKPAAKPAPRAAPRAGAAHSGAARAAAPGQGADKVNPPSDHARMFSKPVLPERAPSPRDQPPREKPSRPRPPAPRRPAELSQEFPVPIPDDGESFAVYGRQDESMATVGQDEDIPEAIILDEDSQSGSNVDD